MTDPTSPIFQRRMIRRYTAQPVPRAALEQLLEAACRAPSPHNRQPWRFAVLTEPTARTRLAHAMAERLRADLARDGVPPEQIEQDAQRSIQRIVSAGAAILVCMTLRDMDVYPDDRRNDAERWMAGQAVAAATQNILLRATELGLGACWMCAPLFCPEAVREVLNLPTDWTPQALITVGYPADSGRDRPRLPVAAVSLWIE